MGLFYSYILKSFESGMGITTNINNEIEHTHTILLNVKKPTKIFIRIHVNNYLWKNPHSKLKLLITDYVDLWRKIYLMYMLQTPDLPIVT